MSEGRDDRHRGAGEQADSSETGPEAGPEVGYGKPPRHTRFKKGTSGNPRGRPRKPKPRPIRFSDAPSDAFFEEEAYRTITLRENGQPIKLPTTQAVMRSLAMEAIKGKRLSQKLYLERVEHAEEKHFQNRIERYVELKSHKRKGEQILAECERKGIAYPDDLLPHPEDIVLGPEAGEVSVTGPSTPEDIIHCEHTAAFRDNLLLRSAHARKMREGPRFGEGDRSICSFLFIATLFDKWLPRRYRWRDGAEMFLLVEYGSLPRRQRERRSRLRSPSPIAQPRQRHPNVKSQCCRRSNAPCNLSGCFGTALTGRKTGPSHEGRLPIVRIRPERYYAASRSSHV